MQFDFSCQIRVANQSLIVRASPLDGAPSPCGLTYLSKPVQGNIGARHLRSIFSTIYRGLHPSYYYFDKLLRLENLCARWLFVTSINLFNSFSLQGFSVSGARWLLYLSLHASGECPTCLEIRYQRQVPYLFIAPLGNVEIKIQIFRV